MSDESHNPSTMEDLFLEYLDNLWESTGSEMAENAASEDAAATWKVLEELAEYVATNAERFGIDSGILHEFMTTRDMSLFAQVKAMVRHVATKSRVEIGWNMPPVRALHGGGHEPKPLSVAATETNPRPTHKDDGEPYFVPAHFVKYGIKGSLLRGKGNWVDANEGFVKGKVRRR